MFVIVRASLDYDHLPKDGITYVGKFDTKELAEAYITSVEEKYTAWYIKKNEQIDAFISQFELPSPLTLVKWKEIADNLEPVFNISRPPSDTTNLRGNIKRALWDGRRLKNFSIQVGQRLESGSDLFIFEM